MPAPTPPEPHVARPATIKPLVLEAMRSGAVIAAADVGILELIGPGAVTCAQGLLTNDLDGPGERAFVFGALLTAKGMIVVDGWAARSGAAVRYTVPSAGRQAAAALLARSVPPRLARIVDRTDELAIYRLVGPSSPRIARIAALPVPNESGRLESDAGDVEVANASGVGPFALQVTAPRELADDSYRRIVAAGAVPADDAALELSRILAGWPAVGAEVDAKTIPQEVRYDEIGGVSYTKGCYTGQETVSRVHFRGHPNRQLLGLEFEDTPGQSDPMPVVAQIGEAGRVTSLVELPTGRSIGLAVLRREIRTGSPVQAGGAEATVVPLPFAIGRLLSA